MSGLGDIFGSFPNRPDHPDFWKLSDMVLKYDGRFEAAADHDEKERIWKEAVSAHIDSDALIYMGFQRAIRALGVDTPGEVAKHFSELAKLTTLYAEGFVFGAEFEASKKA